MLHVLLGALLVVASPTASPAPCNGAHHLFCGAIRLVPRDPDARRAFVSNAVATLFDGIVTAKNTHGDPSLEANPVVRPFIRGRLPGLLLGWSAMEAGQHVVARTFHLDDGRVEAFTLQQHVSGIASWLSPRTYAWMPNEWAAYHQPYAEAAWIRFNATGGRY